MNICMELLNSKVDHADYMGDKSWWGVELRKRVNSPRSCCMTSTTCKSWKAM